MPSNLVLLQVQKNDIGRCGNELGDLFLETRSVSTRVALRIHYKGVDIRAPATLDP